MIDEKSDKLNWKSKEVKNYIIFYCIAAKLKKEIGIGGLFYRDQMRIYEELGHKFDHQL